MASYESWSPSLVVSTIHYCCSRGVSQCDIDVENLLLHGDGNLKIADFGLSCSRNGLLQTCGGGAPRYIAPEVHYGEATMEPKSAGRIPFEDHNRVVMLFKSSPADLGRRKFLKCSEIEQKEIQKIRLEKHRQLRH